MSSDKPKESETRTRILEATRRLMKERRGRGVRMSDVAEAAGVSRQAVYLHFASRTELMVATVRYGVAAGVPKGRLGSIYHLICENAVDLASTTRN